MKRLWQVRKGGFYSLIEKEKKKTSRTEEVVWKLTFPDFPMQSKGNAFGGVAAEVIVIDAETMGWFGLWKNVTVARKGSRKY